MIRHILRKEILSHFQEVRYGIYFVVTFLLVVGSFVVSMEQYRQKFTNHQVLESVLRADRTIHCNYPNLTYRDFATNGLLFSLAPNKMQVLCRGLEDSQDKMVAVSLVPNRLTLPLMKREEQNNPSADLFPHIDLCFIVGFVMSLFVFILSHNAVSRELEQGTLQLVFSNAVGRGKVIFAKCLGNYLGMVFPLLFSLTACLLIASVTPGFGLNAREAAGMAAIAAWSLVYLLMLNFLGIAVSIWTRRSQKSISFLILIWFVLMVVMHNGSILFIRKAARPYPVQTAQEEHALKNRDLRAAQQAYIVKIGKELNLQPGEPPPQELVTDFINKRADDAAAVKYDLLEKYKRGLEREARWLDRLKYVSPSLLYQTLAADIAGTGIRSRIAAVQATQDYLLYFRDLVKSYYKRLPPHMLPDNVPIDFPLDEAAAFSQPGTGAGTWLQQGLGSLFVLVCYTVLLTFTAMIAFMKMELI